MAIFRFSNAGGFKTYQRYNDFLAGNIAVDLDKGSMVPLGVFTLSSAQANVEFTNIPSTYKSLQIRAIARTSAATTNTDWSYRLNGDTTNTNYSTHDTYGDGSTAASNASTGSGATPHFGGHIPGTSVTSGIFGVTIAEILDYASTNKYKTVRSIGGLDRNGAGILVLNSSLWMNTNAVNSIRVAPVSGNFEAYSSIALYGIK